MKRENEYIKEFKNGNISIKFDSDILEDIKSGHTSIMEVLSYTLDSIDCYFIGEEFCISNFDTGIMIYNVYSDKVYILSFGEVYNKLEDGKAIRLYARTPDELQRCEIENYFNN